MLIAQLKQIIDKSASLEDAVQDIFTHYNKSIILEHTLRTRDAAVKLAKMYGIDCDIVEQAALLHYIGGVMPISERIVFALDNGIPVLEEEDNYPQIIYQKISRFIAEKAFDIDNELVLSAIECSLTLKDNPSLVDKVVFIADKIEWTRDQKPTYYDDVYNALINKSLDAGVEKYLDFVYQHSDDYGVIHSWMAEAFDYYNINYEEKDYITYIRSMVGHRKIILCGAIVIIFNDKNQILLQLRSSTSTGKWGLPGGLMEMGESMEENAAREVYEETGIKITDLELVGVNSGEKCFLSLPNGDEFFAVAVCYKTYSYTGVPVVNDNESLELRLFDLNDLPDDIVGSHRFFIDKLINEM